MQIKIYSRLASVFVFTFSLVVCLQFAYFILFIYGLTRSAPAATNAAHPVSVLVCAHNEVSNLKVLVPILLQQNHPTIEVIVVDDRSSDGSSEWLQNVASKDNRLKVVRIDQTPPDTNPKKHALAAGIDTARHEILLLTDADCRPASTRWVSSMASLMDDQTQIVLGVSPYERATGLLNWFIRFETMLTVIQYAGLAGLGMPYMGVGRNLAYRKSLFVSNNGFDEHLAVTGGDDDLLVNRLASRTNVRVCMHPDALIYSYPKTTWRAFLHQKLRHLSVGKYYRLRDKTILGLFGITYSLSWLTGVIMLVLHPSMYWVIGVLLLHSFVVMMTLFVATNRLGIKFEPWPIVILDFVYAIYYISTGLRALVTKRVQWTS